MSADLLMAANSRSECSRREFAGRRGSLRVRVAAASRCEYSQREAAAMDAFLMGIQLGKRDADR